MDQEHIYLMLNYVIHKHVNVLSRQRFIYLADGCRITAFYILLVSTYLGGAIGQALIFFPSSHALHKIHTTFSL
jgi:hypothetical protein